MSVELHIDPEMRRIECCCVGALGLADIQELKLSVMAHPLYQPGFDALLDLREADLTAITTSHALELGHARRTQPVVGRLAVVVRMGVTFGIARQFQSFAGDNEVLVFTSRDSADEWLSGTG